MLTDNLVDGIAFMNMTNSDLIAMLPGKIKAARKLTVLIERLKSKQIEVTSPVAAKPMSSAKSEHDVNHDSDVPNEVDLTGASSASGISLPAYSARIRDVLAKGNILLDLDQFIEETAYHILAIFTCNFEIVYRKSD